MVLLASLNNCKDPGLEGTLVAVKNIITLIQIIAPILLIIMASIHFFNLMKNPDNKKLLPKIKNSFIAAAVIFFIPMLLNVVMNMLGNSTDISTCWASSKIETNVTYMDPYEEGKRSKIYTDPSEYK